MAQRLVVIGDRFVVGCNAERASDLYSRVALRQLPEASEEPLRRAAREHDLIAIRDPQRGAREDRQLALLLARGDDRQRVLPSRARGLALARERAEQAARRRRRAQRRAELHESLIEITRCVLARQRLHQLAGSLPERLLSGR